MPSPESLPTATVVARIRSRNRQWTNNTLLFAGAKVAASGRSEIADIAEAFDVTQSMRSLLIAEARRSDNLRVRAYSPPAYVRLTHDGKGPTGSRPFREAAIERRGDNFIALVPGSTSDDPLVEHDVTDSVRTLLQLRLDYVEKGKPEAPSLGAIVSTRISDWWIERTTKGVYQLADEPARPPLNPLLRDGNASTARLPGSGFSIAD